MTSLILPMFTHILLCSLLYVLLTIARAPSVWGIGSKQGGTLSLEGLKDKISANLSNQFEWPLFFHILCVVIIALGIEIDPLIVLFAWVFIVGRVIHSVVHIFASSIRLRGGVFTLNFLAVLAMWVLFVVETIDIQ